MIGSFLAFAGGELVVFGLRRKAWRVYRAGNRVIDAGLNLRYPQRKRYRRVQP